MKYTKLLALMLACFCCINTNAQMARLYTSESGLANSQINSIYQDSKGFIWIATENGLSRFDGIHFSTFRSDRSLPTSIASNMVLTTYEDSYGTFWIGTSSGLQTFSSEYNTFTAVPLVSEAYPESGQHISSITEISIDGQNKIMLTTSGDKIYILDSVSHEMDTELQNAINSVLPSDFVRRTFADSQDRLWLALEDGGLLVYDLNARNIVPDIWEQGSEATRNDLFTTFVEDERSGNIFIGSFNNGVLIYDAKSGKIRRAADKSARECRVISLLKNNMAPQQEEITYLAGLENEGIRLFNPSDETMKEISFANIPYNTSSWKVHNLVEDTQGNVWVGVLLL